MTLEQFLAEMFTKGPLLLFKIATILLLVLYIAFSIVLLRQVKLMIRVIEAKISPIIYQVAILHLLFSLFVFIWAIIFL